MKYLSGPKIIKRWILINLLVSIFIIPSKISTQGKINIGIGIDLLEYYNISVRYQGVQTQYALGIGTLRYESENRLSISASMYYHFDGVSTFTSRRPWYGKFTLNYRRCDNDQNYFSEPNHWSVGLRVGRDFNLSKRLAINSDIGFNVGRVGYDIPFGFSSGIWLFYRI